MPVMLAVEEIFLLLLLHPHSHHVSSVSFKASVIRADLPLINVCNRGNENKEAGCSENTNSADLTAKAIHTAEQQRVMLKICGKDCLRLKIAQKELFGRIQMVQLSTNRLIQREAELRSKLEDLSEQTKELTEKASEAEKRAEIVEAERKMLMKSNVEVNKDSIGLKSSISDATLHEEQLESRLKDSETKRMHAVASAEASQETIKDMEDLISDLKSKVHRAESQTDSAEDKFIILSESNAELTVEINFLRHSMEHLETSLHRADEAKKETSKDLALQLALERERLHKQTGSDQRDSSETGTNTRQDAPVSEADSIRNIDARQLNFKYVWAAVLSLVVLPLL